jgi:hypothetical protein
MEKMRFVNMSIPRRLFFAGSREQLVTVFLSVIFHKRYVKYNFGAGRIIATA